MLRWLRNLPLLLLVAVAPSGCGPAPTPEVPTPEVAPAAAPPLEEAFLAPEALAPEVPSAAESAPPEAPPPAPLPPLVPTDEESGERMAASHILVSYVGAVGHPMNVHRSQDAARRKAEELRERLQAGEDFATLAQRESDDATRARGGFLGGFNRGTMTPSFEQAAFGLSVGDISEVVESPFGFHIIRREPLAEVHVAQILIQWKGAPGALVERSPQEARTQAEQAWARLQEGSSFEEAARAYSDGAAGVRGGDLGWFTRGQFLPAWEEKAFALVPGETCPPFETSVGYHILRRL